MLSAGIRGAKIRPLPVAERKNQVSSALTLAVNLMYQSPLRQHITFRITLARFLPLTAVEGGRRIAPVVSPPANKP